MSYRSKVLALSATLVALLLIYGAGIVFSPARVAARSERTSLLKGQASEAAAVSLGSPRGQAGGPSLEFSREGGTWVLLDQGRGLPLVASRVEALLSGLAAVKRLSPRSEAATGLEGFGLGPGAGRRIVVKSASGKVMADFELGGYGPTGDEVYLRLGGTGTIYAAPGSFASALGQERQAWLDLKVIQPPLKPEEVSSLDLRSSLRLPGKEGAGLAWKASRKDGGWVSPQASYEAVSVESVLRSILNLEGQDIVALPPAQAFSKVQASLELGLEKGGKIVMEVGASAGEERYYLRSSSGGQVYLVSGYSLGNLLRMPQAKE